MYGISRRLLDSLIALNPGCGVFWVLTASLVNSISHCGIFLKAPRKRVMEYVCANCIPPEYVQIWKGYGIPPKYLYNPLHRRLGFFQVW